MAKIKRVWEQESQIFTKYISGLSDNVERMYTALQLDLYGINSTQLVNLVIKTKSGGKETVLFSDKFNLGKSETRKIGPIIINKMCSISIEGSMSGLYLSNGDCKIESTLCYDDTATSKLRVGVFFDGTGNNAYNSGAPKLKSAGGAGQSKYLKTSQGIIPKAYIFNKETSQIGATTNIWKLFSSFSEGQLNKNLFQAKTYVEGVGTKAGEEDSLFTMGTGWSLPFTTPTGVVDKTDDAIAQLKEIASKLTG